MFVFRKASLALIRKMVHYSSEVLLREVCDSESGHNLPTVLVEITATVLDQEVRTAEARRGGARQTRVESLSCCVICDAAALIQCWCQSPLISYQLIGLQMS